MSACPVGAAGALLVCIHDHTPGDRRHLRVLFRGATPATGRGCPPGRPADGLDVEAVLDCTRDTAQAVRAGGGPRLMELDMSGHLDAIAVLAHRMGAARELDDNALHAVDDHTIRLVKAALAAHDAAPR